MDVDHGRNVTWRLPVEGIDLSARLSVYNLFNNQKTINVHQRYEAQPGQYREATFATGRAGRLRAIHSWW
ncbi:hypothetical protein [Stenotrophomonas sp. NRRL B-14846]|uniref:hypothetical protein n=1 Tax=Stenotrophomonas sp. NRRL B-14846 TaxID=3162882 RepID=UPI003D289841